MMLPTTSLALFTMLQAFTVGDSAATPATPVTAPSSAQEGPRLAQAAPAPAKPVAAPAKPAVPATPAPAMDAKLSGVVDTIQKTYEGTKNFTGSFTQKFTYVMLRRTQESSGEVVFEKPGRMRWDYTKPAPKSFIIDGKALWIVQPADKLAYVNACFQQDGLTASVAFLWGDGNLREQFNIAWFDGVFGAKTDHHLLLTPKDGNSIFARLILVVDPTTSRVKQSVVVDPAGNVNQFMFSNLKFNVPDLAKGSFTYKPTAGVTAQRLPGSCGDAIPGVKL